MGRMEMHMNRSVSRLGFVVLAYGCVLRRWALSPTRQGASTQTLSGTVVDASGAVIPGADVAAKHTGTGVVTNAVSQRRRACSRFPSLPIGTYTVTVTLQGFKTVVIQNVVLTSARRRQREGDDGSRRRHRAGHRLVVLGNRADAVVGRVDDGQHQPDLEAADHHAQRDGLRQPAAGRLDAERQPPGDRSTACRAARSTSRSTASTSRTTRCKGIERR